MEEEGNGFMDLPFGIKPFVVLLVFRSLGWLCRFCRSLATVRQYLPLPRPEIGASPSFLYVIVVLLARMVYCCCCSVPLEGQTRPRGRGRGAWLPRVWGRGNSP